jgi:F-type H+-transporting ATPase subunit c
LRWHQFWQRVSAWASAPSGPALGEGRALAQALSSIAQQPDETNTITRTLFVGMAMVESTAIYCFVVAMILIFANPFWKYFLEKAGG